MQQSATRKKFLGERTTILLFILLFLSTGAYALTESSQASYSFENFPSTTATDYSTINRTLDLTLTTTNNNTNPKVGVWDLVVNPSNGEYATLSSGSGTDMFQMHSGDNISVSFWYKTNGVIPNYIDLFTIGNSRDARYILSTNGSRITQVIQVGGYGGSDEECYVSSGSTSSGAGFNNGSWVHFVAIYERTSNTSASVYLYQNNVLVINTPYIAVSSASSGLTTGYPVVRIGKKATGVGCAAARGTEDNVYSQIDQFDIFNRTLSSSDVAVLYNTGIGTDIFDTTPPQQISSIAPVNMVFESYTTKDFSPYFIYENSIELAFSYNNASYVISYNGTDTITNSVFAMQFLSSENVAFWSFNNVLPELNMQIRACNDSNCSDWTNYFVLSIGYNGTGAYQKASIAPVTMAMQTTKFLSYMDFFAGYTNRYFQYTDPDNGSTILIGDGDSATNSCFNSTIIGENVRLSSNSVVCTVSNVYMMVDDGSLLVQSEPFTVSVYAGDDSNLSITHPILGGFSGFFPEANTISPKTRLTYVMVLMGITLLIGLFIIWNASSAAFPAIGIGAFLLIEFVYFTTIGYIPILWIALFGVLITVAGVAFFTSKSTGTG